LPPLRRKRKGEKKWNRPRIQEILEKKGNKVHPFHDICSSQGRKKKKGKKEAERVSAGGA